MGLLLQEIVIIAVAHQDIARSEALLLLPGGKRLHQVVEALTFPQIDEIRVLGQHGDMAVGIDKGGHQSPAPKVDLLRARQAALPRLQKLPNIRDFPV